MGAEVRSERGWLAGTMRWSVGSSYVWLVPVMVLVGAGALAYWFWVPIVDFYVAVRHDVLSAVAVGLLPSIVWVAAFAWAAARHRSWLLSARLWAGSLLFVGVVFGALSFFRVDAGVLGWFALEGEISLGGSVGERIAGPVAWLGILRVLGVFLLAAAIAAPSLTSDVLLLLTRLLLSIYVFLALLAKRATVWLGRMYGVQSPPVMPENVAPALGTEVRSSVEVMVPTVEFGDHRGVANVFEGARIGMPTQPAGDRLAAEALLPDMKDLEGEAAKSVVYDDTAGSKDDPPLEGVQELTEEGSAEGSLSGQAKFNRFWTAESWRNEDDSLDIAEVAAASGSGPADDLDGPIVDSAAAAWQRPPIDLLVTAPEGGISREEMEETAEMIRRTLAEYSIEVEIGQMKPGPVVTLYGIVPGWIRRYKQVKEQDEQGRPKLDASGKPVVRREEMKTRVKVDSILSREKDLALALKTPSIRIETPVMGKSQIGIEVPNPYPELVTLRGVMENGEFRRLRATAHLPMALGKGSGGEAMVADLARMPHLLIAGATGSGKSVCINTIISGLIMEKTPAEMRLLLIDPKRVELTPYNGIPHLLTPVVVETDQVVGYLKGLIREMLNRYRRFEEIGVRNIEAYNGKVPEKMPMLVVAVDELADLMMSASFDVEQSICRLAQLGRATGIHLIVATQRPSVDVVTGLIKANFPTRISFGVTSQIDSRTILDATGAEKLLGRGDMLFLAVDASRPRRVQGAFVSDREIEALVSYWRATPWATLPKVTIHPVRDERSEDAAAEEKDGGVFRDELLDKAIELAQHYHKLSTSLLQRRMRIGYPRAARLMDYLEEEGIVGPSDGSKSRDVIIGHV